MGTKGRGHRAGHGPIPPPPGDGTARFAYADPPYVGQACLYRNENPDAAEVDHMQLVAQLCREFPDGWALSASSPSLRLILPFCPPDVRVAAYVKPYAAFRPGVSVIYAWEPVLFRGGRPRGRNETRRPMDWIKGNPGSLNGATGRNGFPGQKPPEFCEWIRRLLNVRDHDEVVDMFPGSGALGRALAQKNLPEVA